MIWNYRTSGLDSSGVSSVILDQGVEHIAWSKVFVCCEYNAASHSLLMLGHTWYILVRLQS